MMMVPLSQVAPNRILKAQEAQQEAREAQQISQLGERLGLMFFDAALDALEVIVEVASIGLGASGRPEVEPWLRLLDMLKVLLLVISLWRSLRRGK